MLIKTNEIQNQSKNITNLNSNGQNSVVLEVDAKDLLKDKGVTYYSLYKGTFAYIFDEPSRRNNKVLVKYDKNKYKIMKVSEFLIHLVLWRANVTFDIPIIEEDFHNLTNPTNKTFEKLMEYAAKRLIDYKDGITPGICDCISAIKEEFSTIAEGFSAVACNTISLYDVIQFRKRNKEFRRLTDTNLDTSKTIKDLEIQLKQCEKDLIKVIKEDNNNCFAPYIRSGRVKTGQLTQMLCAVGTRPDIDKTILPLPIRRSYVRGFQNTAEYFMESVTARDAMLTKNDSLPRSGFLSREINRLTSNIAINYKVDDCGTKYLLNFTVENEDYLKMAEGKYYVDETSGKLKEVKLTDKHLVGKTIKMRSTIYCNCEDGMVCKTCVGAAANRLRGTRLGTLPPIKSINPLSQKALSAKHMLGTKSITVTNEALLKYFINSGTDLYLKPEHSTSKKIYIVVLTDDVEELLSSSVLDTDDSSVDARVQLNYVALRDNGFTHIIENEGMNLTLSDDVVMNKNIFVQDPENPDYTLIPIHKLESDSSIFSVILDTEEITKYLNTFIGAIDRTSISRFSTIDELMAEMNRIIYDSGFINKIIHFESIIKIMVRDGDNDLIPADFTKPNAKYQLLKVSSAIEKKDMYTALSFQGLRRLFKDISMKERYGKSLYDPFFTISGLY